MNRASVGLRPIDCAGKPRRQPGFFFCSEPQRTSVRKSSFRWICIMGSTTGLNPTNSSAAVRSFFQPSALRRRGSGVCLWAAVQEHTLDTRKTAMTATQSRPSDGSPYSEVDLIAAYEQGPGPEGLPKAQALARAILALDRGDLTHDQVRGAAKRKQRSDQIRLYDLTNADDMHDWNAGSRLARAQARPTRIASHGHARAARCGAVRSTGSRRTTTASSSSSSDDPGGDTDPGDLAGDHSRTRRTGRSIRNTQHALGRVRFAAPTRTSQPTESRGPVAYLLAPPGRRALIGGVQ